ncbi:hypothetical protein BU16DRAFT_554752 [Lophium mytilinum]|uniref:F-box domain-containing protein n=1 Tax=Lophium mytilinum TaxID=390894 RepID=A0A6A6RE63_9PEZI|nr:hypothetical protein BU16DRAFT_554752 [Lophium mytilinum]
MPQTPKSTQSALAAELHNSTYSPLYTLPAELLYLISSFLSPLEIMSTRATSRKFSVLLPPPKLTTPLRRQYRSLVRRSHFRALCAFERQNQLPPDILVCSACLQSHPASAFPLSEQTKPPARRQCAGSTRVFRVCAHKAVTFAALEVGGAESMRCAVPHGAVRGREAREVVSCRVGGDVVVVWECVLMRVAAGRGVWRKEVLEAVGRVGEGVCPHLRMGVDMKWEAGRGMLGKWFRGWRVGDWGLVGSCEEGGCETSFYVERKRCKDLKDGEEEMAEIVFCVERHLGPLRDAADPRWSVQTVDMHSM